MPNPERKKPVMHAILPSSALHFPSCSVVATHCPWCPRLYLRQIFNHSKIHHLDLTMIWLILFSIWASIGKCSSETSCVVIKTQGLQIFSMQHVCGSFDLLFLICISQIWCLLANERLYAALESTQTALGDRRTSLRCHPSALSLLPCLYSTVSHLTVWACGCGALFQIIGNFWADSKAPPPR